MIGQTVEAKSGMPKATVACGVTALLFVTAALATSSAHFGMVALLPALIAFFAWRNRYQDVIVTFEERGISLFGTQHLLPYEEMHTIWAGSTLVTKESELIRAAPLTITHAKGRFFLPEKLNVPVADVAKFLVHRIPPQPDKPVHESLADHSAAQIEKFGADKVVHIHQRDSTQQAITRSNISVFGKALLLSGTLWLAAAIAATHRDNTDESFAPWFALGIGGIFLGPLFWFAGKSNAKKQSVDAEKHGPACIVLGPTGLGLAQGELQGKLRWEEITGVKNGRAKHFGDNDEALHIHFAGGSIILLDIYDRPLMDIAGLIRKNTGPM